MDKVRNASRALAEVVDLLSRGPGLKVLDLGSATGSNVDFLSRFGANLTIADLRSSVADRGVRSQLEEALLLPGALPPYDLALVWDLFDYLEKEDRKVLGARLRALMKPGGRVFCMVSYREEIPLAPRRFYLVNGEEVDYEDPAGSTVPSPRIKEPELLRSMPGFEVDNCYLLRCGVQEYLLSRLGESEVAAPRQPRAASERRWTRRR